MRSDRISKAIDNAIAYQIVKDKQIIILYKKEDSFNCICISYSWPVTQLLSGKVKLSVDAYKYRDYLNNLTIPLAYLAMDNLTSTPFNLE